MSPRLGARERSGLDGEEGAGYDPSMPADRQIQLLDRESLGEYVLLKFRHPEVAHGARAGQFVMIKAGSSTQLPLRRPFSILKVDRAEDSFTLFVKPVGSGSRALSQMHQGDEALCLGPLGRPFTPPPAQMEALLVAGGYGIAPFWLFCEELRGSRKARLFYGGRRAVDLPLGTSFRAALGVPVVSSTEDGSEGWKGRVTDPLEAYLSENDGPSALYACGPHAMLEAVARLARRRGLCVQVSLDPWMGCGVGTCLSCVVRVGESHATKYRCACTDGPVFDGLSVEWPLSTPSKEIP